MERINTINIAIEIDTNKDTYRGRFDSMDEANDWFDEQMRDMYGEEPPPAGTGGPQPDGVTFELHGEQPAELLSTPPEMTGSQRTALFEHMESERKKAQRKPLLSDAQTTDMLMMEHHRRGGMNNLEATKFVRDFYEAKITSGELLVVKTAKSIDHRPEVFTCELCATSVKGEQVEVNFCPGCGAKIID